MENFFAHEYINVPIRSKIFKVRFSFQLRLRGVWLIVDGAPNFHEKATVMIIDNSKWAGGAGKFTKNVQN